MGSYIDVGRDGGDQLNLQSDALLRRIADLEACGRQNEACIAHLEASGKHKDAQIALLKAVLQRCTCQPKPKDLTPPDWGLGLPLDLLALVAGLGGHDQMKAMRGVCKQWQQGYESSTTGLTIGPEGPLLPTDGYFCKCFPMLASLHLGDSPVPESDLVQLAGLKRLRTLSLGTQGKCLECNDYPGVLFSSRVGKCFSSLPLSITDLSLNCCYNLLSSNMQGLRRLPLTKLNLSGLMSYSSLEVFRGMQSIRVLELESPHFQDSWLEILTGMPLTSLNLSQYRQSDDFGAGLITGAGLEFLKGAPLTSSKLSGCIRLKDESLGFLKEMPLSLLDLSNCPSLTDAGIEFLREMSIMSLDLGSCGWFVCNASLCYICDMPLTYLSLRNCGYVTGEDSLRQLRHMPLTKLDLGGCYGLIDTDLKYLLHLPLVNLNLSGCIKLTSACVEDLLLMPLKKVGLVGCHRISDRASAELILKGIDCIRA